MTPAKARRQLLAAARQLLTAADHPGPFTVVLAPGVVVVLTSDGRRDTTTRRATPAAGTLGPEARALLAALTDVPSAGKEVAARAGLPFGSYVRTLLHDLVEDGHARWVKGGYRCL